MRTIFVSVLVALCTMTIDAAPPRKTAGQGIDLDALTQGQSVGGFRVTAVYLNDSDHALGARFVHEKSGFTLDLLQIESIPQGYTWVNSFPVSDQGEPHTQEHLLLGKGTTGRAFAGLDTMWLAQSNAFTQQWRTSYHFNTAAGPEVFFDLFAAQMNALLNPNYTDDEIRREVRNFGVTQNSDGTLRLEEKGSVYNEMVSSSGNPFRVVFRSIGQLVYGTRHPLAYNSGGEPSGIRTMKPEDIRRFHDENYYLGNMGTIAAFPKSIAIRDVLTRIDGILTKLQPQGGKRAAKSEASLPKPNAAAAGTIAIETYPQKNDRQPSPLAFGWPAVRNLDAQDKLLLDLFLANIAGDSTTNLYKRFIDSKTRTMDIGAKGVFSGANDEQGQPFFIVLNDVNVQNLTKERVIEVRQAIVDEIAHIASLPDGSPELKEFNDRLASRIVELHRDLSKFVNSPPGFGFRNTRSSWMDHLLTLERTSGFRKSVTMKPQLARVNELLASGKNLWRERLAAWQVTGVVPYVVVAKPSPEMIATEEAERTARSAAEAARLQQQYGSADTQEAIKRYRTDYDAESAKIELPAKTIAPVPFVKSPPMTLDDTLDYKVTELEGGVPLVASTFENMTSGTTGLALRFDGVKPRYLSYVSLLPALLSRVGVIENGKPVSYDEMAERLRKEILSLEASFSTNPRTGRVEIVVRGSGNDAGESQRAVAWMNLVLSHPDWRPENLARIRDVVDQVLAGLRNTMRGPEEAWVNNPATAYRMQQNPLYLAADSFLTRSHNALHLRWKFKDVLPADREPVAAFLTSLSVVAKDATRAELKAFVVSATASSKPPANAAVAPGKLDAYAAALDRLSPAGKAIAVDALKDLDLTLMEIPDGSLAADWAHLCTSMRDDLLTPPAQVLTELEALRREVLESGNARFFVVGSTAMQRVLAPPIGGLLATFGTSQIPRTSWHDQPLIDARLRERDDSASAPVFVGLVAPNMNGGVVINSASSVSYSDWEDKEKQLDYLASRLHAGYGAHGIFLKTIGAGLAYSNGLRGSVTSGRIGYYAERTPELPQTVRFVVSELKNAPRDTTLADYAIAQVFGEQRSGQTYEARAEAMAADLVDDQAPDEVRKFRHSILELRKDPKLGATLFDRKDKVYAEVLPGYGTKAQDVFGGSYFVIGPDKQLDAYRQYLESAEGSGTKLFKLNPRDFWMDW